MELAANLKVVGWLLQSIGREGIRPREGYTHVAIVLKLARFMLVLCYGLVVARNFKRVSQEPVSLVGGHDAKLPERNTIHVFQTFSAYMVHR
jgi:hypothetical protein